MACLQWKIMVSISALAMDHPLFSWFFLNRSLSLYHSTTSSSIFWSLKPFSLLGSPLSFFIASPWNKAVVSRSVVHSVHLWLHCLWLFEFDDLVTPGWQKNSNNMTFFSKKLLLSKAVWLKFEATQGSLLRAGQMNSQFLLSFSLVFHAKSL